MRQYTTEEIAILEAKGYKLIDGIWTKHHDSGEPRVASAEDHARWAAADLEAHQHSVEDVEVASDIQALDHQLDRTGNQD